MLNKSDEFNLDNNEGNDDFIMSPKVDFNGIELLIQNF
jgi:hypothetical protein